MNDFQKIEGISDAWLKRTEQFQDSRGYFFEEFRVSQSPVPIPPFLQDSISYSKASVLRGLHMQVNQWQLVTLLKGEIVDVLVDLRRTSPTYLQSISLSLSKSGLNQLLLHPGIAHGYVVISEEALIHYKSSVYYGDSVEFGINWQSEELAGNWPQGTWEISERDVSFPTLQEFVALDLSI